MSTLTLPERPSLPVRQPLVFWEPPPSLKNLSLREFSGREGLSELFEFRLCLEPSMPLPAVETLLRKALGQPVTFGLHLDDGSLRTFKGLICRFADSAGEARYEIEIVPRLWLLRLRADCRTYVDLSVPEIVEELLREAGIPCAVKLDRALYRKRPLCVQYRETGFHFFCRLLEEEGITYEFANGDGLEGLVLSDGSSGPPGGVNPPIAYRPRRGGDLQDPGTIDSWRHEQELRPARYSLTGTNFKDPGANLEVSVPSLVVQSGLESCEIRDSSLAYETVKEGERLVRLCMEEEETPHVLTTGTSTARTFAPGGRFRLTHPGYVGEYTLVSATHVVKEGGDGQASSYRNSFVCIPARVRFRPPRVTTRPIIAGTQTAVVVGPKGRTEAQGRETHVDEYGRIKIRFFWDRLRSDRDTSCWVRVGQAWAGRGHGSFRVPRLGEEAVVSFLDGNPDHPVIVDFLFTTRTSLPYPPQEHPTCFTLFRSHSSPEGERNDASELSVEDRKGAEQVRLQSQRDLDLWVANETHEQVVKTRHLRVGELREQVDKGHDLSVKEDVRMKIGGNEIHEVDKDFILKVKRFVVVSGGNFLSLGPEGFVVQANLAKVNCGDPPPAVPPMDLKPPAPPRLADGR